MTLHSVISLPFYIDLVSGSAARGNGEETY